MTEIIDGRVAQKGDPLDREWSFNLTDFKKRREEVYADQLVVIDSGYLSFTNKSFFINHPD